MVDSAREGDGQEGANSPEQGDQSVSAAGGEEAAADRGVVSEADIGLAEEEGGVDISRAHLRDDPGGRERRAASPLPAQDEVPAAQEARASDGGGEHPGEGEHPRAAAGGGRAQVRRLGDGPDTRERAEERDPDPVREEQELSYHGEASAGQEAGRRGRGGHQAAVAVQEERADDNHGQRGGVLPAQEDSRGAEDHGLLRRQLLLVAERGD